MKTLADLYIQAVTSYRQTLTEHHLNLYMEQNPPSQWDYLIPALQYLARFGDPEDASSTWEELKAGNYTKLIDIQTKLEHGELSFPKRGRPKKLVKAKQPSGASKRAAKRRRNGIFIANEINKLSLQAAQDFYRRTHDEDPE